MHQIPITLTVFVSETASLIKQNNLGGLWFNLRFGFVVLFSFVGYAQQCFSDGTWHNQINPPFFELNVKTPFVALF